ncbi:hypothetical protein XO09_00140 [Thermosipho sp. 1223]|nr:hypothetical protein [Thermosipho sp. 1244]OOC47671.1 hypothetical protein XO09_00140 [Thermosipho sp. 1223]
MLCLLSIKLRTYSSKKVKRDKIKNGKQTKNKAKKKTGMRRSYKFNKEFYKFILQYSKKKGKLRKYTEPMICFLFFYKFF